MTGFAAPDYNAALSLGMPYEPEDSQYGEYRLEGRDHEPNVIMTYL